MKNQSTKGQPKRDGSGRGVRANKGRGGCDVPQNRGIRKPIIKKKNG